MSIIPTKLPPPAATVADDDLDVVTNFPEAYRQVFDVTKSTFVTIRQDNSLFFVVQKYVSKFTQRSFSCGQRYGRQDHNSRRSPFGLRMNGEQDQDEDDDDEEEDEKTHVQLLMGHGLHEIEHNNHKLFVYFRSLGQPVGTNCGPAVMTLITIYAPEPNQRDLIESFLEHILRWSEQKSGHSVSVYFFDTRHQYWRAEISRLKRPVASVVLPTAIKGKILDDVDSFVKAKKWYVAHGVPYRRSYLLYGSAGSGKTSFIQAIAGHINRDLCFLQPNDPLMTDNTFKTALLTAPAKSVIVAEDIDALFSRDRKKSDPNCPLTFSGLLNALDGIVSPNGQIFMFTTNHIERLDPALIRAGRVDMRVEFPLPTKEQIRDLFMSFYPNQAEWAERFATTVCDKTVGQKFSMAALQNHFICNRTKSPEFAATNIDFEELLQAQQIEDLKEKLAEEAEEEKENHLHSRDHGHGHGRPHGPRKGMKSIEPPMENNLNEKDKDKAATAIDELAKQTPTDTLNDQSKGKERTVSVSLLVQIVAVLLLFLNLVPALARSSSMLH